MSKEIKNFLSIAGVTIAGISMIAVFYNANAISNQVLTPSADQEKDYVIGLFTNIIITFVVGGVSLKVLLRNLKD